MNQDLPNLNKVRGRVEAPAKPTFFDSSLLLIGGKNPLGEPNLKVSWGWDLRMFRNGDDRALKYPGPFLDRWILEKWLPPDFFGSEKHWEQFRYNKSGDGKNIDLLGPFPRQGQYGMVMPLITKDGDFIPLGSEVLVFIDRLRADFESRTLNVYSDAKLYARLQESMAVEEAEMQQEQARIEQDYADYVTKNEFDLNQDKAYSMPTIWTPDGEHPIH